jgi:hypothetical protein
MYSDEVYLHINWIWCAFAASHIERRVLPATLQVGILDDSDPQQSLIHPIDTHLE